MVSNKTLAMFIILTVIVSLGGTLLSLNKLQALSQLKYVVPSKQVTGMVSGQVNLSITTNASCSIDSNVSFGSSGQVLGPTTISTNLTNAGTSYNDCTSNAACRGMMINNTGNVNVNVTFNSTAAGSTFLGTADSDFQYDVYNGTNTDQTADAGCRAAVGLPAGWATVPTTATKICNNLTADDAYDIMTVEYNVTLYPTTPPGTKSTVITVACAQN